MSHQTQKQRVLEHLRNFHTIEPLQALSQLGVYRLASVIHLLKQDGWPITSKRVEVTNRWGETCNVAQYTLELEDQVLTNAQGQREMFHHAAG